MGLVPHKNPGGRAKRSDLRAPARREDLDIFGERIKHCGRGVIFYADGVWDRWFLAHSL